MPLPHQGSEIAGQIAGKEPVRLSRREALKLASLSAMAAALPACASKAVSSVSMGLEEPLYFSTASQLRNAIRNKEVSCVEVVTACLNRIDSVNAALNAVVQLDRNGALQAAKESDQAILRGDVTAPLHGLPMTIKDSLDTRGMISTGGTLGRQSYLPKADATVVSRLRNAGAILMGKTNTPELTLSFDTNNLVYGQTHNPFDLSKSPGGSSGGAAAIIAAGGSPFDIGSDYGGSIRLPAHFNGICGLKPTAGRVPRTGHIYPFGGIQDSFQQLGPLARSVDDLALLLPIIMGPDGVDPGALPLEWHDPLEQQAIKLRVAWFTDNGISTPTPETQNAVQNAATAVSAIGAKVKEDRPPGIENTLDVLLPIYFWDGGATIRRLLREAGTTEHTLGDFTDTPALQATELEAALLRLDQWRSALLGYMQAFDVLICPVNSAPTFTIGSQSNEILTARGSYAMAFNALGWPAVVLPAGQSATGLPIGVQVVAGPGREDRALAVAQVIEQSLGGYQRPIGF
ncbi:MAG: amidase [Xanthomonadales bacterium]|nr:amidase [Xanthomonadales bacterium]